MNAHTHPFICKATIFQNFIEKESENTFLRAQIPITAGLIDSKIFSVVAEQ